MLLLENFLVYSKQYLTIMMCQLLTIISVNSVAAKERFIT